MGEGVRVFFATEEMVETELVIGADGWNSVGKKYIAPDSEPIYSGKTEIIGLTPRDTVRKSQISLRKSR